MHSFIEADFNVIDRITRNHFGVCFLRAARAVLSYNSKLVSRCSYRAQSKATVARLPLPCDGPDVLIILVQVIFLGRESI
jgi:hypothetical protein